MTKLDDEYLKNDSKLQARLGMKPSSFVPGMPTLSKKKENKSMVKSFNMQQSSTTSRQFLNQDPLIEDS